jgi:ornithine carbamoyltransferase
MKLKAKHFLTIKDLTTEEVKELVVRAAQIKSGWKSDMRPRPLRDKVVALIFQKPSMRTRVSFEVGITDLGGHCLFLSPNEVQIGSREPAADVSRVMSRYVDALVVRCFEHTMIEDIANFGHIPVINALTDRYHPCQVMSDLFTVMEQKGNLMDQQYAWIGDGNNMANSWLEAAGKLGLDIRLACPKGFEPGQEFVDRAVKGGAKVMVTNDPKEAMQGADVVNTDVWASMGQEDDAERRRKIFGEFTLDSGLMKLADPEAIVLHCLPAHRGEEISEKVLEGPQCVAWDQAENRLHMQKAIMEALEISLVPVD